MKIPFIDIIKKKKIKSKLAFKNIVNIFKYGL